MAMPDPNSGPRRSSVEKWCRQGLRGRRLRREGMAGYNSPRARMMELVDIPDLKSGAERRAGSIPAPGTIKSSRSELFSIMFARKEATGFLGNRMVRLASRTGVAPV